MVQMCLIQLKPPKIFYENQNQSAARNGGTDVHLDGNGEKYAKELNETLDDDEKLPKFVEENTCEKCKITLISMIYFENLIFLL